MIKIKNSNLFIKFVSLLSFAITIIASIFLFKNHYILADNIFTIIIQILAVVLMVWARITFGFESFHASANTFKKQLVVEGPYKWIRHPIYAAVIYFFLACIISYPNSKTIIAVTLIVASSIVRMLLEEKSLVKKFANYDAYYKETKRFIPFIF